MDESSVLTRKEIYERLLEARERNLPREVRSVHSPFVFIEPTIEGVRIGRRRYGPDRDWDEVELKATPSSMTWEMTFFERVSGSTTQLGTRTCAPSPYDYDSKAALEEAWAALAPDGRLLEEPSRQLALDMMRDWASLLLAIVR